MAAAVTRLEKKKMTPQCYESALAGTNSDLTYCFLGPLGNTLQYSGESIELRQGTVKKSKCKLL